MSLFYLRIIEYNKLNSESCNSYKHTAFKLYTFLLRTRPASSFRSFGVCVVTVTNLIQVYDLLLSISKFQREIKYIKNVQILFIFCRQNSSNLEFKNFSEIISRAIQVPIGNDGTIGVRVVRLAASKSEKLILNQNTVTFLGIKYLLA